MENELKPCPFCGGEAQYLCRNGAHGSIVACVICRDCGAQGASYCVRDDICAKDEAIKAWNRRWKDG